MPRLASFLTLAAALLTACGQTESRSAQPSTPAARAHDRDAIREVPNRGDIPSDDELSMWVERLDDDADPLHNDYTPAVHELSARGRPAALAVLPSLESGTTDRRLHAQRVVEGVVRREFGWQAGQGFTNDREAEYTALIRRMGYAYDAPEADRHAAAARWHDWLSQPVP